MIFVTVLSLSVAAAPVKAAASAGDLIKMDGLSSVYYLGGDGKRYVFPNEQTYFSWYSDFSSVMTIPQAELESYPLGANVTIRPGTKLVKITTNPKVYAVTPGGNLVAVPDEATAKALYGDNWAKRIVDVPDAFFTNYKVSASSLTATAYPTGSLIKTAASPDIYYIDATGAARKIANESAFTGNRFQFSNVITTTLAIPAAGAEISGADTTISDTSSGAGGTVYTGGSGVTVALAGTTPASASVPKNGARVPMAKVNLTAANDGAVTVSALNLKRIGLSTYSQIDKVWAEKDGVIVASKKTVNSNDEASLTFSPALVISAGQTVTVELLASLLNASGNIGLSVVSATAGGANVAGLPVNGNLMAPIDYAVTNLALTNPSTVTSTVKVGDEKVELGKFTVEFNTSAITAAGLTTGVAAKDVTLKSIMVKNNGIEDLAKTSMNLYLEYNGNKVSESAKVDGRYVTFFFPAAGFDLLKDDTSKQFLVKGDVIGKENTAINSYAFVINKSTDVVAYEKSTGFGVNVYNDTTAVATVADNFAISNATITAGVVAISKKSTSPSATTIIKGSDNTILLANIRADEAITADGLTLTYGSADNNSATVNQFENVRVYLNGTLLDSFDVTATSAAWSTKVLTSSLTLNKGDNEVKVMVKAKTSATAGSAFLAKVDGTNAFTSQNPQYVSSGNAVASGDISGSATGGIFTVQGAALATVRNDGFAANKIVVKGSPDVVVGKFALKATNDEVKVTSVSLGANTGSTTASSIYDAKLYTVATDGTMTQVGNTVDFGTSGATFSSLNVVIPKDTTKTLAVKVSFDSAAVQDSTFQTLMTVNAQDSRGTAITSGNTATSQIFLIKDSGTLNVDLGGNAPQAAILAAKAIEQEVAQYKFTAVNDSANLTEINFVNQDQASSTIGVASADADSIVAAVRLYKGATLVDETLLVSGVGKFVMNDEVIVPANGNETLSVKVVLNTISNDATATNKDIQIVLKDIKFKSSAGTETGPQVLNKTANAFRVRKTIPTVALQTLPTTVAAAGDQVIMKFTVTADAAGDVSLYKLNINATSSGYTIAGLGANAVRVNGVTKGTATSTFAGSTYTVDFGTATPEVVAAGTTKTFEVIATIGGAPANGSVTAKIDEDASYVTNGTGNFVWSDGADITNPTYSNGRRVPGLPTATQSLTK